MSLALMLTGKSSSESHKLRKQTKEKETMVIDFFFLKAESFPTTLREPVAGQRGVLAPAVGWAAGRAATSLGTAAGPG